MFVSVYVWVFDHLLLNSTQINIHFATYLQFFIDCRRFDICVGFFYGHKLY